MKWTNDDDKEMGFFETKSQRHNGPRRHGAFLTSTARFLTDTMVLATSPRPRRWIRDRWWRWWSEPRLKRNPSGTTVLAGTAHSSPARRDSSPARRSLPHGGPRHESATSAPEKRPVMASVIGASPETISQSRFYFEFLFFFFCFYFLFGRWRIWDRDIKEI